MDKGIQLVWPKGELTIFVDDREYALAEELEKYNCNVVRLRLDIGDCICSKDTVIERKTREDFENSIIDKRIFRQLEDMSNYKNKIVIIEGTAEEHPYRVKRTAVLGAYAAIITDYGAGIFFTKDTKGTAELIYAIAKHEQMAKKSRLGLLVKKRALTPEEMQLRIIEALPTVGPELAEKLLAHFGSVRDIFNADITELEEVEGIGKKRAKLIWRVINKR